MGDILAFRLAKVQHTRARDGTDPVLVEHINRSPSPVSHASPTNDDKPGSLTSLVVSSFE